MAKNLPCDFYPDRQTSPQLCRHERCGGTIFDNLENFIRAESDDPTTIHMG